MKEKRGTNLGIDVPLIGQGEVPEKIQQLIIAMFQEYVLPEFAKFNAVLQMLSDRVDKLEKDKNLTIRVEDRLYNVIYAAISGVMPTSFSATSEDRRNEPTSTSKKTT